MAHEGSTCTSLLLSWDPHPTPTPPPEQHVLTHRPGSDLPTLPRRPRHLAETPALAQAHPRNSLSPPGLKGLTDDQAQESGGGRAQGSSSLLEPHPNRSLESQIPGFLENSLRLDRLVPAHSTQRFHDSRRVKSRLHTGPLRPARPQLLTSPRTPRTPLCTGLCIGCSLVWTYRLSLLPGSLPKSSTSAQVSGDAFAQVPSLTSTTPRTLAHLLPEDCGR